MRCLLRKGPVLAAFAGLLGLATLVGPTAAATGHNKSALPQIGHVFIIALENESYATTFGNPGADPYLD